VAKLDCPALIVFSLFKWITYIERQEKTKRVRERERIHLMLIRKSANTRPATKLITSRYRKTPGREPGTGISLWLRGPQCIVKINRPRFKSLALRKGENPGGWNGVSAVVRRGNFPWRCSGLFFTFKIWAIGWKRCGIRRAYSSCFKEWKYERI